MDMVVVIKNMVAVESDGWIKICICMWTILPEKWHGTKQSIKSKTCMQSALCNNKPAKQAIYIFHHHIHHISSMFILFAPMFHIFATLETPTLLAAVRSSASSVRFTGELPSVETSSGSSAPPLGTGDDSGGVGTCLMLGSGLSLLMTILGWLSMGYVAAFLCGHSIPHNLVISCTNWKRAHDIQSSGKHFHLYLLLISGYWCEIRGYHTTIDDLTWPTWQSAKRATFPARARMCQVKYPHPPNHPQNATRPRLILNLQTHPASGWARTAQTAILQSLSYEFFLTNKRTGG